MKKVLKYFNDKTIGVTGASGYIGTEIVKVLLTYTTANIICITRTKNTLFKNTRLKIINGNITNFKIWENLVKDTHVIFHLAGNTSIKIAKNNPVLSEKSTLLPISLLIKAANKHKKKPKIIYASTVTMYGLTPIGLIDESYTIDPLTFYDLHKSFAENELNFANKNHIIESTILRLSNVYGPSNSNNSSPDRGILNMMAKKLLDKKSIQIFGHGNYIRDYIYIDDVVAAFLYAASSSLTSGCTFNIGSGKGISIKDAFSYLVKSAKKVHGENIKIEYTDWPLDSEKIEIRNFTADISFFKKITSWSPKITFSKGVDNLITNFSLQKNIKPYAFFKK